MPARFKIGTKVYEIADVQQLPMRALLFDLPVQTEELGQRLEAGDVEAINNRLEKIKDTELRGRDPEAKWGIAITIWASRLLAGETVTIAEALSFPSGDLAWLPDTADHQSKTVDPTRTRAASVRGAKSRPAKAGSSSRRTSKKASTGG